MAGAGKKRLYILQQWRHHQLKTMAGEQVQRGTAQAFKLFRVGRQEVFDVFRKRPGSQISSP